MLTFYVTKFLTHSPCCTTHHPMHPSQVGVHAVYCGQEPQLSQQQLQELRQHLPAMPPPLFGRDAACCCCRTAEQVLAKYGAMHGQRIQGEQ